MSVIEIARIDLVDETYDLAPKFPNLDLTGASASVALLPVGRNPTGTTTVWFSTPLTNGTVTPRFAGPDADSSGVVAVSGTSDIWAKVTTADGQVDSTKIGRVNVLGGGAFTAPASVQALIGLDTDGVPFYDPGGIGTPAPLTLDSDGVLYYTVPA